MTHPNLDRVDHLLQFSLLAAGEEDDPFDRQLGPIHLIKYVYLADFLHSQHREGETYTGIDWQFYKFGPWSQEVNQRIDEALAKIHANKAEFHSDYGKDDWIRWELSDNSKLRELGNALPVFIAAPLRTFVHKYGKDTASLLDFVYRTAPMLKAAPHEFLNFSVREMPLDYVISSRLFTLTRIPSAKVSNKKRKKFAEKMRGLRDKDFASSSKRLVNPVSNPRHDAIWEQGVQWLDSLAGEPLPDGQLSVRFDPTVWKSKTRLDDELP